MDFPDFDESEHDRTLGPPPPYPEYEGPTYVREDLLDELREKLKFQTVYQVPANLLTDLQDLRSANEQMNSRLNRQAEIIGAAQNLSYELDRVLFGAPFEDE